MSGIAAVVSFDGSPVPRPDIERLANVLKPYGRDRQKIAFRDGAAFVACSHQLTPEDQREQQPLFLADRFAVLFDGRIDNRPELGTTLGLPAHDLRSMPDNEIALRLFDRWGERGFERIVGVFAIIVIDHVERTVICARDQMGLRVLHYHHSRDRFAVATAPEVLFALSWVPQILNKDKVADAIVQRGLNGETTYFHEVFRVLPGSILKVERGTVYKHQYWSPDDVKQIRLGKDDDYVEAFRECLHGAVRSMLRSRRGPCATITGGLDSSSIAVVAADILRASGQKLHTYTAVPEPGFRKEEQRGFYFDETPYVRLIAEANGNIVPHYIPPSDAPIVEQIARQIRISGAPVGGVLNGLWGIDVLTAARAQGHEVMLSGEMGNLTMSYNGWLLLPELLRNGRLFRLATELMAAGHRWRHLLRHRTLAPFIPAGIFRMYKQWRRGGRPPWDDYAAISPDFAAHSGVIERAGGEFLPFDAPPPSDRRVARLRTFHSYSETADWFAKVRAHFGIDIRTPAFDRRVVEFCFGIPQDQYLRSGTDRWLIRRAMKGRLPPQIVDGRKDGVQAADWFPRLTRERDEIQAALERLADNPNVAELVDFEKLGSITEAWPANQATYEYGTEMSCLRWALPQALGAAFFIDQVTRTNSPIRAKNSEAR